MTTAVSVQGSLIHEPEGDGVIMEPGVMFWMTDRTPHESRSSGTFDRFDNHCDASDVRLQIAWGVVLLMQVACGGEAASPDSAVDASPDAPGRDGGIDRSGPPPWDDPSCHHDCFAARGCQGGVVSQYLHGPVSCASWTGSCPAVVVGVCPGDCSDRTPAGSFPEWQRYCEGSEEKRLGDPCTTHDDCQPPAPDFSTRPARRIHLHCYAETSSCQFALPPILPNLLGNLAAEQCEVEAP